MAFTAVLLLCACPVWAQKPADTAGKVPVNIIHSTLFEAIKTDTAEINKLIGDVQLEQNGTLMYCDSAYINLEKNNVEAFGSVKIVQPGGTTVQSDYLQYTGNTKDAYLRGNVALTDGKSSLWSEDLTYNLGTKIGIYTKTGTLQSESTILSSTYGNYNVRTKDARFTGNVRVNDPQYNTVSDDLGYNTATKLVRFYAASIVTNDKSRLYTSSGTYDSKAEIAHFTARSSIWSGSQYLEGDKIDYNRTSGFGTAQGNVIAIDTVQKITLYAGIASYNEVLRTLKATIKPVLKKQNGTDSLFIRADTFYSAPDIPSLRPVAAKAPVAVEVNTDADTATVDTAAAMVARVPEDSLNSFRIDTAATALRVVRDSVAVKPVADTVAAIAKPAVMDTVVTVVRKRKPLKDNASKRAVPKPRTLAQSTETVLPNARNQPVDSTAPRFFIGYNHVRIFSDSLQGLCDSISYTQRDSTLRMMTKPVSWSRNGQITGDTILLTNDSGKIKRLYVPNNAFIVNQSGPDQAKLWDQVQGKTLTGNFVNNALNNIVVWPAAEAIYYTKDEKDAYIGVDQSSSERMKVFFQDQNIDHILYEQEVKHTLTPMVEANFAEMRLSRFHWRAKERPKSVAELFE